MVSGPTDLPPDEALDLDIDLRIGTDGWTHLWTAMDRGDLRVIAPLVRFAYGRGYCDALTEPRRGQLCTDHGMTVPTRRERTT